MSENKNEVATYKRELPTLADLHHDPLVAFEKDQFNLLVNQAPPKNWIKQHPMVTKKIKDAQGIERVVPSEYIGIDTIELLLTRIFQDWSVEILREGALFQSIFVTVRLHLIHPVTGRPIFFDGTGAVGVQVDKGKSASDLSAIKSAAIQMALPSAKSYAIKDAAEHIGKLFGKDLNRQSAIDFTMSYYDGGPKNPTEHLDNEVPTDDIPKGVIDTLEGCKTKKEANEIFTQHPELHKFDNFKEMIKKRHAEIDLAKMQAEQTQ